MSVDDINETEITKIVKSTDTKEDVSEDVDGLATFNEATSWSSAYITVDTSKLEDGYMPNEGETLTYIATVTCGDFEKTLTITAVTPATTGTVSYALVLKDGKDMSEETLGDGSTNIFDTTEGSGTAEITLNNPYDGNEDVTSGYALDTGTYTVKAEWTDDGTDMNRTKNLTVTNSQPAATIELTSETGDSTDLSDYISVTYSALTGKQDENVKKMLKKI